MAVEIRDPHTIHLAGDIVLVNDIAAGEEITPGALVDRSAGTYVNHAAASVKTQPAFALEQDEMNAGQHSRPHVETVDYPYADGDLIKVGVGRPGATFWALLASGQNVADGDLLSSAGDGTLEEHAGAPADAVAAAIESVDNTAGDAPRVRVEVI